MVGKLEIGRIVSFPAGDNATDTVINDEHFNLTALQHFNYTLWSNDTLSNVSRCFLVLEGYRPVMFANGTFINGTSCYDPYFGVHTRGATGIAFACLFAASIVVSMTNLRKHGRLYLPSEKRFRAVGRRWQWYWLLFVGTCGAISGFTGIDVDRAYLQGLAIILQNFFLFMMIPGILAAIWESVRHWGSWQERQIYDRDSFLLQHDDKRSKKEFWMPLIFYLFNFMNFFMTVPRSWTKIQYQRSLDQQLSNAKPVGTDGRFKAATFFAFLAWGVICYSLRHSIHYYKPRNRGWWNSLKGFFQFAPVKYLLAIPLALVVIGHSGAIAFEWTISPLRSDAHPGWIYGLGYAPILLIIVVLEIFGFIDRNEDRVLLEQRRMRERTIDAEIGIGAGTQKPSWWSKRHGGGTGPSPMDGTADASKALFSDSLGRQTAHGNQPSMKLHDTTSPPAGSTSMPAAPWRSSFSTSAAAREEQHTPNDGRQAADNDSMAAAHVNDGRGEGSTPRRNSTAETNFSSESGQSLRAPPVKIRSMLDV